MINESSSNDCKSTMMGLSVCPLVMSDEVIQLGLVISRK